MFNKKDLEEILNKGIINGADFSEIYIEQKKENVLSFSTKAVKELKTSDINGIGLRLIKDENVVYASMPIVDDKNEIIKLIDKLSLPFDKKNNKKVFLNEEEVIMREKADNDYSKIKTILINLDKKIRKDPRVSQVIFKFQDEVRVKKIASSIGNNIYEKNYLERLVIKVHVKDGENIASHIDTIGATGEVSLFNDINKLTSLALSVLEKALCNLYAVASPGGKMPVVIANGFGGVLFHEAAGHALEATLAKDNLSVLSNKKNEKIASSLVTIIDDGTIFSSFGSNHFDDEGNKTKKNILIKNGVLTNYLVDYLSQDKMMQKLNGCARRESFMYAPTSRMSNTYLEKGSSTLDEMISSIDYGLYCISMPGGQVIPTTGDFNFGVSCARMIRNGKISEYVKGVSLIGNIKDILEKIEMVGNDLEIKTGYCGSVSGMIPVTVGQPSIKVSNMLVGGSKIDD